MSRIARVVAIGYPHHITQRGNYGQAVFTSAMDYSNYLKLINIYKNKNKLLILAYCVMPNHVHFVVMPSEKNSMSRTFNTGHMCYSQYFNKKNNLKGHLWQGRFYSCILDEKHLYHAVRYVENNPVRAGLVDKAGDWQWSSAIVHLNRKKSVIELEDISNYIEIIDWNAYLLCKEDQTCIKEIRSYTKTGMPLGEEGFVNKIEVSLNRHLDKPAVGRPAKKNKKIGTRKKLGTAPNYL